MKPSLRVAVLAVFASASLAAAVLPADKLQKAHFWSRRSALPPPSELAAAVTPGDGDIFGKLHNTWWKLKVTAKGFSIDNGTLATTPATFKTTAYMYVFIPKPLTTPGDGISGFQYGYQLFTQPAEGEDWTPTFDGTLVVTGLAPNGTEALTVNNVLAFFANGGVVGGDHNGRLQLKVKDGVLQSGDFSTIGTEVYESTLDFADFFYANMQVTGHTVPVSKLPFPVF
jgi:hypothetical protein